MTFIAESDMIHGSPLHGWTGRFFHSANMTFARWTITADAHDLHEHHHEQEEVWNIVGGSVVLVVDGDEKELGVGTAAVIPPNAPHSVKVIGAAEVVVTDFPVRDELPGITSA